MKVLDYLLAFIIVVGIAYYFLFPNTIEVKGDTEYIKGDSIVTVINQNVFDSLQYDFEARLKIATRPIIDNIIGVDTVWKDSIIYAYSSRFELGDSTQGASGLVTFDMHKFSFSQLSYRSISTHTVRIDTFKITNNIPIRGFTHGPAFGAGYGLIHKEFDIFVGYTIQFNF